VNDAMQNMVEHILQIHSRQMPLELNVNMPDKEFLELLSKFSLYKTTSNTALVGPELLELSSADFMARALRFALIRSSEIETYFLVFHLLK
jgi:hypothetical protein